MTQHSSQQYAPPNGDSGHGDDRWSRRPRRSANDRKIAGVAGGLGRAFGVDPIILRIAFVVLAIFGGSGVLLYALGWLLLPADGDEVSGIEGLIGRGRSSMSPLFAILLIVIALSSAGSVFSWGLPFWPVVIGAILVFLFARRGRMSHRDRNSAAGNDWNASAGRDWNAWGDDVAARATRWADDFSDRASRWGQRAGQWGGPRGGRWGGPRPTGWGCSGAAGDSTGPDSAAAGPGATGAAGRSPFDAPAFWDTDPRHPDSSPVGSTAAAPTARAGTTVGGAPDSAHTSTDPTGTAAAGTTSTGAGTMPAGAGTTTTGAGTMSAGAGTTTTGAGTMSAGAGTTTDTGSATGEAPSPSEMLTGNRTPPAWDPLGVAPFAWDLPDPTPVPQASGSQPQRSGRSALSRAFVGVALLAGALAAVGVIAGWWALSWAEVSAIALTVVGVGLIIAALRGRGRPLIGPGIFLALLTVALTVTGVNGTNGYGAKTWTPTTIDEVNNQTFTWNAGDGTLDLSDLVIPADQTVATTLDVRAGEATVLVPENVTVHATCSANVGRVSCLTAGEGGVRPTATDTQTPAAGSTPAGTLNLTVEVGAGHVTVRHG